eukprot:3207708-Rhodomonas_salina.1
MRSNVNCTFSSGMPCVITFIHSCTTNRLRRQRSSIPHATSTDGPGPAQASCTRPAPETRAGSACPGRTTRRVSAGRRAAKSQEPRAKSQEPRALALRQGRHGERREWHEYRAVANLAQDVAGRDALDLGRGAVGVEVVDHDLALRVGHKRDPARHAVQ